MAKHTELFNHFSVKQALCSIINVSVNIETASNYINSNMQYFDVYGNL